MAKFSEEKAEKELKKRQKKFSVEKLRKLFQEEDSLFTKFLEITDLKKYTDDFVDLFALIRDWYQDRYKDVPWRVISSIGAGLLYVLSPIDLIPDFLPVIGYLDDAAVIAALLKFVRVDLEEYRNWKGSTETAEV